MNPRFPVRSSRGSVRRIRQDRYRRSRCLPFRSGRMQQKGATRRELPRLLLSSMYAIRPLPNSVPQPAFRCQIWDENTLYLSPIPHLSTMVLAAIFAHCHAEAFLEEGFRVICVAEATLLCQTWRGDFGFLKRCRPDCKTLFRNESPGVP